MSQQGQGTQGVTPSLVTFTYGNTWPRTAPGERRGLTRPRAACHHVLSLPWLVPEASSRGHQFVTQEAGRDLSRAGVQPRSGHCALLPGQLASPQPPTTQDAGRRGAFSLARLCALCHTHVHRGPAPGVSLQWWRVLSQEGPDKMSAGMALLTCQDPNMGDQDRVPGCRSSSELSPASGPPSRGASRAGAAVTVQPGPM